MTKKTRQSEPNNNKTDSELTEKTSVSTKKYNKLNERYNALLKLTELSNECSEIDMFFGQVHQTIASLMAAKNFYIVMFDQVFSTLEFVYHVDEKDKAPEGVIPLSLLKGSLTNYVIETGKPLLATPTVIQELADQKQITNLGADSIDWLGVPLLSDGYVIGVMAVQSYTELTRYLSTDLEMLTFAAQHIVTAMVRLQDRERLQNAVDARTKELMQQIRDREKSEVLQESLYRISELTNDDDIDINKFYNKIHQIIGRLLNAANFYIAKYDSEREVLTFVYYQDQKSTNLLKDFQPRKLSHHYTELIIRKGETLLLSNQDMVDLHNQGQVVCAKPDPHSWLGVPLKSSNEVIGAMVVQSYNAESRYTEQDAELLNFVSHHISTAIKRLEVAEYERKAHELLEQQVKLRTVALEDEIKQRKQAEELLRHTASHDSLTGLPNRAVFMDLLNHAIACGKRRVDMNFAVLFLDLDRFKVVNDSLGHHAGDKLLKIIAKELKRIVRDKDTVARLGGDEFVILIEDLDSEQEAYDVAGRITELLSSPIMIEKQPVFIGTSIGVLFSDSRYESADTMLRDADTAMYYAKDKGKGRYEVFDASMQQKVQNALQLETDIREAIELEEFTPYFQPITRLSNDQLVGFEALARWNSNKRGFVYPNDFIPIAEETSLVLAIDFQILEKACIQLKQWQKQYNRPDLYISCNLFCNHFFSTTLADDIAAILKKVGLPGKHLRVELTERALLENSELVLTNMKALKQLGVKILLDDFGTGYSSLSYLHRFPIDVLKIDRSFINNVNEDTSHRAIIKTIIDLATNLKMATVGEGIENEEDAKLLRRMDCNFGQGYFFAKPMTVDTASTYIQEN